MEERLQKEELTGKEDEEKAEGQVEERSEICEEEKDIISRAEKEEEEEEINEEDNDFSSKTKLCESSRNWRQSSRDLLKRLFKRKNVSNAVISLEK